MKILTLRVKHLKEALEKAEIAGSDAVQFFEYEQNSRIVQYEVDSTQLTESSLDAAAVVPGA
jgi:hypothetical protein